MVIVVPHTSIILQPRSCPARKWSRPWTLWVMAGNWAAGCPWKKWPDHIGLSKNRLFPLKIDGFTWFYMMIISSIKHDQTNMFALSEANIMVVNLLDYKLISSFSQLVDNVSFLPQNQLKTTKWSPPLMCRALWNQKYIIVISCIVIS